MVNFIASNTAELIYKKGDSTYLHYNGSKTNPDFIIISTDIINQTRRKIMNDPGSGYNMIKTTTDIQTHSKHNSSNIKINLPWNFKKANWENYKNQLDKEMQHVLVEEHQTPDKINNLFCKTILKTAKENIP